MISYPDETPLQTRFFLLLSTSYPRLYPLWDRKTRSCDPEAALRSGLSSGEAIIFRSLFSIWCGCAKSEYKIDFTDLANLEPTTRKPLIEWLQSPFFP